MLSFLAFLGILLLIYDITLAGRTFGNYTLPDPIPNNNFRWPIGIICGLFLFSNGIIFKTDSASNYTLQYPIYFGAKTISGDGNYHGRWFAKITKVDKEITIDQLGPKHWQESQNPDSDWTTTGEIYQIPQNRLELNDKMGVYPDFNTVLDVSTINKEYTKTVLKTKSEKNFVYTRLLPYIQKCQLRAIKLLSSEQYIVGGVAAFDQYVLDQYNNGPYELVEDKEAIAKAIAEIKADTLGKNQISIGGSNSGKIVRYKRVSCNNCPGGYKRTNEQGFSTYGITVIQAGVKSTQSEDLLEKRFTELKKIAAAKQQSKENRQLLSLQQEEEKAQGELAKIKEQKDRELKAIAEVVEAKAKADKAYHALEEEKNLLEAAKVKETRIAIEARNIQKLRNAGIDPKEELKLRLESKERQLSSIFGGSAFSNLQTMMSGSGQGGDVNSAILTKILLESLKQPE